MKIRVTFEVDDTDRVAISVAQGQGFKQAPREELEDFILDAVNDRLGVLRERFQLLTEELEGELKA